MHFQIYKDLTGKWRWRLKSGKRIVAVSGQDYTRKDGALRDIKRVQKSYDADIRVHDPDTGRDECLSE